MLVTKNTTSFSSHGLKTIATKVYQLVQPELTNNQLTKIGWKKLKLQFVGASKTSIHTRSGLNIGINCTESKFASYFCGLLRWRANLPPSCKLEDIIDKNFSNTKQPLLKSKPKSHLQKEVLKVEIWKNKCKQSLTTVQTYETKLSELNNTQQLTNQKIERTKVNLKKAKRIHLENIKIFMHNAEKTTELTGEQYAMCTRAKRNAEKNAPRTR